MEKPDSTYDKIRPNPFPDRSPNPEHPADAPNKEGDARVLSASIRNYCTGFNDGFDHAYRQFVKGALIGAFIFVLARLLRTGMDQA